MSTVDKTEDFPISEWAQLNKKISATQGGTKTTQTNVDLRLNDRGSSIPSIVIFTINQSFNELTNSNFSTFSEANITQWQLSFSGTSITAYNNFYVYITSTSYSEYTEELDNNIVLSATSGRNTSTQIINLNFNDIKNNTYINPNSKPINYILVDDNTRSDQLQISSWDTFHPYLRVTYTPWTPPPIKIKSGSDFIQAKSLKVRQNGAWVDTKGIYQYKSGAWVKL